MIKLVKINGINQYYLESNTDSDKPVMLFIHGGPGSTLLPFSDAFDSYLRDEFNVIHWDQRCAGKSYDEDSLPKELSIEDYVLDCIEMVKFLSQKFNKKIFLVGHSWGGLVGIRASHHLKKYILAYIGVGQLINTLEGQKIGYEYALRKASEDDRNTLVKRIGRPPYNSVEKERILSNMVMKYGGVFKHIKIDDLLKIAVASDYYSPEDWKKQELGFKQSDELLHHELVQVDLLKTSALPQVPCFFIQGEDDYATPLTILENFLKRNTGGAISIIKDSGHFPFWDQPKEFSEIISKIRNIVISD